MSPLVERAVPGDAEALHRLREQIEAWLDTKAVEQWGHGHLPLEEIAQQIGDWQWYVVRDPVLGICGAARLLWSDPEVWGEEDRTRAVYVHGLMVHRTAAGRDLGPAVLDWAAEQGRVQAAEVFRLDCVESNAALRAFYRRQGFREIGRRDFNGPQFSATLLEKRL